MLSRVIFCSVCATAMVASASAQMDGAKFTAELRQKYAPSPPRDTFAARPGLEMIVDFAPNGNACRIQLPPRARSTEPGQEGVISQKAIDDFVTELLPPPLRGKEVRRGISTMGRNSVSTVEYEDAVISEHLFDQRRTGVTIRFPNEPCNS